MGKRPSERWGSQERLGSPKGNVANKRVGPATLPATERWRRVRDEGQSHGLGGAQAKLLQAKEEGRQWRLGCTVFFSEFHLRAVLSCTETGARGARTRMFVITLQFQKNFKNPQ